jgi:succinyl-diaminopimelate desuccinylase
VISGKSAHAARPETGHDALEGAARVLNALYAHRKVLSEIRSAVPGIASPTLVVGLIRGGINTNVVPGAVTLRLDRRIIPEENSAAVERQLKPADSGERRRSARHPLRGAPDHAGGAAEAGARTRAPARAAPAQCRGGVRRADPDARRAPLYRRAPLRGRGHPDGAIWRRTAHPDRIEANAHTADERLPLMDLRNAAEVVALTLLDLLGDAGRSA